MKFKEGDEVIATKGRFKGCFGEVLADWSGSVFVKLAENQERSGTVVILHTELEPLPAEQTVEDEEVDEIPVYDFGISAELLETHLEWFVGRALGRLGEVGPAEALFGFQEFEGKAPHEVILELMGKLEEGAALLAQTHILLGRIVMALESVHDQNS